MVLEWIEVRFGFFRGLLLCFLRAFIESISSGVGGLHIMQCSIRPKWIRTT